MPANFKQEEINLREVANEVCGLNEKVAENTQALLPLEAYAGRNLLINGDFTIAQRGTTFTDQDSATYTLDRQRYSGSTSFNLQNTTITQETELGVNSMKILCNATATGYVSSGQRIERYLSMSNKTYTLSGWVRSNNVNAKLRAFGDVSNIIYSSPHSGGGEWEKLSLTITNGDLSTGVGYFSSDFLIIADEGDVSITNGDYIECKELQLELGSHATEFEYVDPATQLARCQRYYIATTNLGNSIHLFALGTTDSLARGGTIYFPVTMRDTPSVSIVAGANTSEESVGQLTSNTARVSVTSTNASATCYLDSYTAESEL